MTRDDVLKKLGQVKAAVGRDEHGRGDHELNPGMSRGNRLTAAAVLVPLVEHRSELAVLLTQRTDHLLDHAGQISFPGGRIDDVDADAIAAALRETEEEVGIPADRVDVIGRLDDYETRTGFLVTPVVGVIEPPYPVVPDPFEVADVFEVPLPFIMDPENHQRHRRVYQGVERYFYVLPFEGRYIWGATAGMLVNLYEVLSA
ncbi:MAG: CoA pyrophosphatase [Alphaproteobacteria bacterium]|nr:CoA pyrophosphatase [Alphaproteobacteria bacterium]